MSGAVDPGLEHGTALDRHLARDLEKVDGIHVTCVGWGDTTISLAEGVDINGLGDVLREYGASLEVNRDGKTRFHSTGRLRGIVVRGEQ